MHYLFRFLFAFLRFRCGLNLGDRAPLRDEFDLSGGLGGGGGLSESEKQFRSSVLAGVKKIADTQAEQKSQQAQLLENYNQLDASTKKAMEELTKVKNEQNSMAETAHALKKLNLQLRREQRMAFGDPIKRLLADEEKRCRLNAMVRHIAGVPMTEAQKKALGEDTSPGSTMLNDELALDIYDTLAMYGKWNTLGVQPMGTKITKLPISTARPVANFILSEAGEIADDTNKAGTSVSLDAEVVAVLLLVSKQLIDDAEIDVAPQILNDFIEAFNYRLDYAVFQGDGTENATSGGVTGIFNAATAAVAANGNTTIETTDWEDWTKCLLTVDEAILGRNARWWIHMRNVVRSLSVKDANGRPLFLTAIEAPAPGAVGSILGYPIELVSAAPNANTVNSKVAVFGDPEAYKVGIRQDFTFEMSDQYKFNTLQRAYRAYGRADGKMRRAQGMSVLTLAGS